MNTGPALQAIIFDFGGVIITPITNKLARIAQRHGTDTMAFTASALSFMLENLR